MARTVASKTKPSTDETTAVAEESVAAVETVEEDVVEDIEPKVAKRTRVVAKPAVEPLQASDEIVVTALIPNVRYYDKYTADYYTWDEVGQTEYMTFETIERMWRNSKGYFRNMWLKPEDDRVIKKYGLSGVYDKYSFLMDEDNYTVDNMDKIYEVISSITQKDLKISVANKIKSMVADGKLVDINVIKGLESKLRIDLTSFI